MKYFWLLLLLPCFAFASPNTVVYNITNETVVHGSLNNQEVSIASISKLMTAYTVLTSDQDLNEKLTVKCNPTVNTNLSKGMILTRRELVELSLVSSDNVAAITLAENYHGGHSQFMHHMNQHAQTLGMTNSRFVEPTGLSPMNYSSIADLIILTKAVSEFDIVRQAANTTNGIKASAEIHSNKKKTNQSIIAHPTISYFGKQGIITIKTGFTRAAGFCVTMLVKANDKLYNITVLGAKSKEERQRIVDASLKKIYNA